MKLRTSFFNGTVLRKDITRFAPVWGLYTIFLLMTLFLLWKSEGGAAQFANNACYVMQSMGIINFCYAAICGVLLFGDLFVSRMCNALHSFPMRREGWFVTHCFAGFLFSLVPNLLGATLAGLLLQEYYYVALLWLALMGMQYLFFFGAAVFAVMCAGTRLGAAAVYGIFNFFAVIASWLFVTFYSPLLYGINLDIEPYLKLSPVVGFSDFEYILTSFDKIAGITVFKGFLSNQWQYLFVSSGIGLVLLILSLLMYRKRHLENAGNFMSFRPVSPIFLIIYTLSVGAIMYYAAELFASGARYVFLVIGFAIGFFTGRMLLEKRVNVFRGKVFLGFGILLAVFGLTVAVTKLDPAGITYYVPQAQEVQQVKITPNHASYYYENSPCILTEQADIEAIIQIHQDLVENRKESKDLPLTISYTLKSGRIVERQYYVDIQSQTGETLKGYYSSPQYVLGTADVTALLENAFVLEFRANDDDFPYICVTSDQMLDQEVYIDKYDENTLLYLTEELSEDGVTPVGVNIPLAQGLMEAIIADCEAGKMAQQWEYHEEQETFGWITIQSYAPVEEEFVLYADSISRPFATYEIIDHTPINYLQFRIFSDCTNTIEYLNSLVQE